MERNLFTAEHLRDLGIAKAEDSANTVCPNWSDKAYELFKSWLHIAPKEFMTEEFRAYAKGVIEEPKSNRAFGAIVKRAAQEGIIYKKGYGRTSSPKTHKSPATIWSKK
jgi:hypothetical protein